MGVVVGYYVSKVKIIDCLISSEKFWLDYSKLSNYHEFNGEPYWSSLIEVGDGGKAWNPLWVLLSELSDISAFKRLLNRREWRAESNGRPELYVFEESDVLAIWNELEKISIAEIRAGCLRYCDEISVMDDVYHADCIHNHDQIIREYMELFSSVYRCTHPANQAKMKMIVTRG